MKALLYLALFALPTLGLAQNTEPAGQPLAQLAAAAPAPAFSFSGNQPSPAQLLRASAPADEAPKTNIQMAGTHLKKAARNRTAGTFLTIAAVGFGLLVPHRTLYALPAGVAAGLSVFEHVSANIHERKAGELLEQGN